MYVSHTRMPSQVCIMVQLKPSIDMNAKLRYKGSMLSPVSISTRLNYLEYLSLPQTRQAIAVTVLRRGARQGIIL